MAPSKAVNRPVDPKQKEKVLPPFQGCKHALFANQAPLGYQYEAPAVRDLPWYVVMIFEGRFDVIGY